MNNVNAYDDFNFPLRIVKGGGREGVSVQIKQVTLTIRGQRRDWFQNKNFSNGLS